MTTPVITTINPSKSKTWIGLVGAALTFAIPFIVQLAAGLDQPWPAVIAAVVAVLTALGVYKAPYKPEGTSVVSNAELNKVAIPTLPVDPGTYENPWKKK